MSSGNERDFRVYIANRGTFLLVGRSDVSFAGACPSRGGIMFVLSIKRLSKFQLSDLMKNHSAQDSWSSKSGCRGAVPRQKHFTLNKMEFTLGNWMQTCDS